jgi:quinoprotein glucose dehydrogenase
MRASAFHGLAALATLTAIAADARVATADGDWTTINRDQAATRFSPLADINRSNVSALAVAWSYPLRSYGTQVPLVIGGTMYFPAGNRIVALDAETGKELWVHTVDLAPAKPADPLADMTASARKAGSPPPKRPDTVSTRGVGYWPGDARTPARVLVMVTSKMIALDAKTGAPVSSFGKGGIVDVGVSYGGTPTIAKDVVVIGAATLENPVGVPGNPRAFDVRTGKKLWEFQTVPTAGQKYNETWGEGWKGRSGTNMWSFSAPVDEERNLVFIPVGSPAPNYWGGSRPGTNLFGNSLVALDLKTGKYRWHFQTVHHDLWDADMPTAGSLIDVTINGKKHPAIANVGKTSYFFVFDRETGKPLHEVQERPVPKGDVPGEYYHPTQPFPVKTPPLSRVSMTKDDIVTAQDTSPEHAAACKVLWDKSGGFYNAGPFTPFLYHEEGTPPRSTIQFPGGIGGVNWGGPAVDPTTGWVFVNALDTSLVGWTEKRDPKISYSFDADDTDQPYDRASVDGKGPFFSFSAPLSGKYDAAGKAVGVSAPCYKPPWARLTAVDANTGEVKWAVPLGIYDQLPAGKQLLGNAGSAGPTVTAGGLVFVGATNDKRFRAFDATNGKQLWESTLGNSANANPISYRGRSGKQYVAINAGGVISAFSLPR